MKVQFNGITKDLNVINPEDQFNFNGKQKLFVVGIKPYLPPDLVFADNAQDALDIYADYAKEQKWDIFLTDDKTTELEKFDQVAYVGNFGLPIDTQYLFLHEVR